MLLKVRMPAPSLVRPPLPSPMTPEMVVLPVPPNVSKLAPLVKLPLKIDAVVVLVLSIVPAPLRVISLLVVNVPEPVILKVPAFIAKLLAAPKLLSASTLRVPPLMLVMPECVLVPESTNVPAPVLVNPTVAIPF